MDPRMKEQDTVFEVLEKGNFIAPPGGDDRDLEDTPALRGAMRLILPGTVLTLLLPGVVGQWLLLPFLGGLLLTTGCLRLGEEGLWFKLAAAGAVVQALLLAFCLLGDTTVPALKASAFYPVAEAAAAILAAAVPALLAPGMHTISRSTTLPAGTLAAVGIALTLLRLTGDSTAIIAVRTVLAVAGTGMLVWILVAAGRSPEETTKE